MNCWNCCYFTISDVTFILLACTRCDAWLPKGLAAYLCSMYRRKAFGMNDYRYKIAQVNLVILFLCS